MKIIFICVFILNILYGYEIEKVKYKIMEENKELKKSIGRNTRKIQTLKNKNLKMRKQLYKNNELLKKINPKN